MHYAVAGLIEARSMAAQVTSQSFLWTIPARPPSRRIPPAVPPPQATEFNVTLRLKNVHFDDSTGVLDWKVIKSELKFRP